MPVTDEELARTREETEATNKQFAELERQVAEIMEQREALARQYGASSFSHLVEAAKRSVPDDAKEQYEKEKATFLEKIERDLRDVAERFHLERSKGTKGGSRSPRSIGRMV